MERMQRKIRLDENTIRIVSKDLSPTSQPKEIGKITFRRHKPRPRNFLRRLLRLDLNTQKLRDQSFKKMNTDLKYEKVNIELRRSKVLELLAKGHSQTDIAKSLGVSPALISIDVQYIREQSKKRLETHFQDQLPYEYARAMTGINATLKRVSEMLEENKDPKIKIECMKLQMDLWKSVMSMATDGGIIQRAIAEIKRLESSSSSKDIPTKSESEEDKDND